MADQSPIAVALASRSEEAARWCDWLEAAGVRVTRCADRAAVGALRPRPSVAILDAAHVAGEPGASAGAATLAGVPVIVMGDESLARLAGEGATLLPRSSSRAALVGTVLAMSAGLHVAGRAAAAAPSGDRRGGSDHAIVGQDEEAAWLSEAPTARELQVLALVGLGLTNRAVAERLGLSGHTVKFHLASAYGKLGARGRTQAVRRAIRRGWIAI